MRDLKLNLPACFKGLVATYVATGFLALPLQAQQLDGEAEQIKSSKTQLIATLARRHGLAAEQLAWANGLKPASQVEQGTTLTIPRRILPSEPPENGIVVNLAERGGYVFESGRYQGFFPVSIGRSQNPDYHTPTGQFEVLSRVENPEWNAPDSDWAEAMEKDRIAADSENNPLGEYWFGFNAPGGGYGFHENTAPDYTGDAVSHGCMRLYPEDARELYNDRLLEPGDTVRVINEPVRLARTEDDTLYVAVFPLTYEKFGLKQKLQEAHVEGFLDDEKMDEVISKTDGVPRVLLSRQVKLSKPGQSPEDFEKAFLLEGRVIMPTTALTEFDVNVEYDDSGELILKKGNKQIKTIPGESGDIPSYRLGNSTFVEAAAVLSELAVPYQWIGENKTLEIGGDAS